MKLFELKHHSAISLTRAKDLMREHCSLAYRNWRQPIVRGFSSEQGVRLIDTLKGTIRKSVNTSNYYTIILDATLPPEFPRRSRSIICSNFEALHYASDYGNPHAIIPFDDAKIGIVPGMDMFGTTIHLLGYSEQIDDMNDVFERADLSADSFDDFITDFKAYADANPKWVKKYFYQAEGKSIDELKVAFAKAYRQPFDFCEPGSDKLIGSQDRELWVGGKAIAIPLGKYIKLMGIEYKNNHLQHYVEDDE